MKNNVVKSVAFAAAVCLCVMPFLSFAEVKALSFAINPANTTADKQPIRDYMGQNGIDFGAFETTKASSYFVNTDFKSEGRNFGASCYQNGGNDFHYFLYDSDKYELVDDPALNKTNNCMAAAFRDEFGDTYVLVSMRGRTSVSGVKYYLDQLAAKYSGAKLIVTYNALLGTSNANTLNASITDSSGAGMTCLGRTDVDGTAIGGVYVYPDDVPASYSVSLVPNSIGTKYNGTLATLGYPAKCTVVFNDWDGTGLQTNIVYAGESVTPPTVPGREGYTFTGWDRTASDFASVPESFTATAQYAANAATLIVSGDPENLGTADPGYGTVSAIAADDTFTASVVAPAAEEDATERWVCTGYTHYEITDLATGAKTVAQEGGTASFAYTHVFHDELVWHFTNEWLVAVSATQGGSVSVSESWVRNGETLQLVATPDEGWEFLGWRGDTNGVADITSASIAPTVAAARTLKAAFAPVGVDTSVQYVATSGDDANSGYTSESPKLTIQAAVNTLAEAAGNGTVHVAPGIYQAQSSQSTDVGNGATAIVAISAPIAVVGDTGNPEDVIVRNTSTFNQAQAIVLYLSHPSAFVANLTAENAHRYAPLSGPFGGNVAIDSAGGIVSNCVIRNALWYSNYGRGTGAWLNSANALLTHCVITNNTAPGNGYQTTIGGGKGLYGGLFVHVDNGNVANCLIANNRDSSGWSPGGQDKQSWSSGVTVREGCLLNCTVATNEARWTGGIYLHQNGYATNVVVAGCVNRCSYLNSLGEIGWSDIGFKGTLANASHCASDGGEALDESCVAGTAAEFFRDFAGGDYQLAKNSPLRNKGIEYDGIAEFDLLGKKRVQGRAPDIGCYEARPNEFILIIR